MFNGNVFLTVVNLFLVLISLSSCQFQYQPLNVISVSSVSKLVTNYPCQNCSEICHQCTNSNQIDICTLHQICFQPVQVSLHQSVQDDSKGWPGDVVSREQPAKGDPQTNFGQECNPSPSRSAIIHMVLRKLYSFILQALVLFCSTDVTRIPPKAGQGTW